MSDVVGEPYRLAGSRLFFTNWFHVLPAEVAWYGRDGKRVYAVSDCPLDEAHFSAGDAPGGVSLMVRKAERTEPIFGTRQPWEQGGVAANSVLQEEGGYRAWASLGWGDLEGRQKPGLGLYESDNGLDWRSVDRGEPNAEGQPTNIVYGHGGYVFRDSHGPASERYKLVTEAWLDHERLKDFSDVAFHFLAERKDVSRFACVKGAVSPDGISWQELPKPLLIAHSDTLVTVEYDSRLHKYIGYFRSYMLGSIGSFEVGNGNPAWIRACRRSIGRSETEDFRHFPVPRLAVVPPLSFGPSKVFYTNCKTTIPGAPDHHVMFPAVWDQANDSTSIFLGTSHDNETWQFHESNSVLDTASSGKWDGGCIFASPQLLELPGGDFVLPYVGYNVPHKYPRQRALRNTAYARWPRGRLAGITAAEHGSFSTVALVAGGIHLRLNADILRSGSVKVEVVNSHDEVVAGRSFAESSVLFGDCHWSPVVWKNHDDLGVNKSEAVRLRFRLTHATIYGLEFC